MGRFVGTSSDFSSIHRQSSRLNSSSGHCSPSGCVMSRQKTPWAAASHASSVNCFCWRHWHFGISNASQRLAVGEYALIFFLPRCCLLLCVLNMCRALADAQLLWRTIWRGIQWRRNILRLHDGRHVLFLQQCPGNVRRHDSRYVCMLSMSVYIFLLSFFRKQH